MKKTILLSVFIASIAAAAFAAAGLELVSVTGKVNKDEIGGEGLCVVSLWDTKGDAPVGFDGDFESVVADSRPQKIFAKDEAGKTRALAIVFPDKADDVFFDAESTALALLFRDATFFRDSATAESVCARARTSGSFHDLALFLKGNLLAHSLEELMRDEVYRELFENCTKEIFGQDQAAAKKSLNKARDELKDIMKEISM